MLNVSAKLQQAERKSKKINTVYFFCFAESPPNLSKITANAEMSHNVHNFVLK